MLSSNLGKVQVEVGVARPDHDLVYVRFQQLEQLDELLVRATDQKANFLDVWRAARDARELVQLMRRQVLK